MGCHYFGVTSKPRKKEKATTATLRQLYDRQTVRQTKISLKIEDRNESTRQRNARRNEME
jgi:hypothetical protein